LAIKPSTCLSRAIIRIRPARPSPKGQQKHNKGVTEIVEIPNRGHALTVDSGWREVADKALGFIKRFV